MKRPSYTMRPGTTPISAGAAAVRTIAEIMVATRGHVPNPRWLMEHFGMCRATAYRWRRAFIDAGMKPQQGAP